MRIPWDPERDLYLEPQTHRAIQMGLAQQAVALYVNEWIQNITDVTPLTRNIRDLLLDQQIGKARPMLPTELAYHPA